jgi:hypothetical protein
MLRKAKTQNIQFATRLQMVAVIREADGEPVSVLAKRRDQQEQTIYTWRKRFSAFQANDIRAPEASRPRMRG